MNTENDVVWIYKRVDGTWDWRRVDADNNQIVSTSGGQGYEHEDDCIASARDLNPGVAVRHYPEGD